jgi:glyoxylase-like metal-dependent hydrolase (beta-lactamase superfamily II)
MNLIFEQIRIGGDRNFGYLLGDRASKKAVMIDPAYSPQEVFNRVVEQGLTATHIINTHGHTDHINGNSKAQQLSNAPIAAHPDSPAMPGISLKDGAELSVGALRLQFMHTPGHCDDHLVIYEKTNELLITGDLLFVGKVGGTHSEADARTEWKSLQRVLAEFPEHATVWPGHDYGARPSSTLKLEKLSNPFLLCKNVDEFIQLKNDWAAFKKKMGLK